MAAKTSFFGNTKILICAGSGGVGKTTLAGALGVMAAREGARVLVLTIDPSLRLARTLGIEGKSDITLVPGQKYSGKLYASIIDHKKTFDDFILRSSQQAEAAEKILQNRLYQQLSTNLSGSQDFTALEKLYSAHESNQFDLIILDTPPAQHALDFLRAPQKLVQLFNEGIARWLRDPYGEDRGIIQSLLYSGTKQVLKILESLTGSEFIRQLSDFFTHIQSWQSQLEKRIMDMHRLLASPQTQFLLVTGFDSTKMQEAEYFVRELKRDSYFLRWIVLNRYLPNWFASNESFSSTNEALTDLYAQLKQYYADRQSQFSSIEKQIDSSVSVVKVPDFIDPIYDLQGLEKLAQFIESRFRP